MPSSVTKPEGQLYVVSAPSGAGKTSLLKALLDIDSNIQVSISHTTREKRTAEQDGRDYHFVSQQRFEQLLQENAFIEHARVFDNFYGTAISSVSDGLSSGKDLILEIDWQGAQQVRKHFPAAIGIYILPPSRSALLQRLSDRGQDDTAIIERRMKAAIDEMSHYPEFDYLIINDQFEQALAELQAIVTAMRQRQNQLGKQRKQLLDGLITH